jgi:inorganic pyrophosphatase
MELDVLINRDTSGQRNKYEADHASGRIRLDRTLFTATQHPGGYGLIFCTGTMERPVAIAG